MTARAGGSSGGFGFVGREGETLRAAAAAARCAWPLPRPSGSARQPVCRGGCSAGGGACEEEACPEPECIGLFGLATSCASDASWPTSSGGFPRRRFRRGTRGWLSAFPANSAVSMLLEVGGPAPGGGGSCHSAGNGTCATCVATEASVWAVPPSSSSESTMALLSGVATSDSMVTMDRSLCQAPRTPPFRVICCSSLLTLCRARSSHRCRVRSSPREAPCKASPRC
mmetsp:Transcript_30511/g.90461  ORF Transcript_30511/g.90461 Transcript_30511/m.90461 type:complete len:227 (+) Transcript_30511:574-1254(+)